MRGLLSKVNKALLWFAAIGIFPLALSYTWFAFTGDTELTFIGQTDRGYEFSLENKSSLDATIESLRFKPDLTQPFIFRITGDDLHAVLTPDGAYIEGGNLTYIPAYEFKELDNAVIQAKSKINFRIPPLIAKEQLQPEAMIVYAKYRVNSFKNISSWLSAWFGITGFGSEETTIKYLVAQNYWTKTNLETVIDALEVACRETDWFRKSESCAGY